MPFVPANNSAMVEIVMNLDEQVIENTLYFEASGPFDVAELNTLAANVRTWWDANLKPILTQSIFVTNIKARALDLPTSPGIDLPINPVSAGAVAVDPVPNNVALAVKFITGLSGRSFRGRNYIAGLPETVFTKSRAALATTQALANAYAALNAAVTHPDAVHAVCSRYSGVDADGKPIPRAAAVMTPITAYFVDQIADSQRRRLPGRGR